MELKLNFPFVYEGKEVKSCKVVRRPKVKDRAKAVLWAKSRYGEEDLPDAISLYLISQLCTFNGKEIPPEVLEENLDYEDFVRIWEAVVLFRPGGSAEGEESQESPKVPDGEGVELQRTQGDRPQ